MSTPRDTMPLEEIIRVFDGIDVGRLSTFANDAQKRLSLDKAMVLKNGEDAYKVVTQVDIGIQNMLLEYFDRSSLRSTYGIVAEEPLVDLFQGADDRSWQLVIDPLDGTSSYLKQGNTWGSMVGACDVDGRLCYSWNIISTGEVYTSCTPPIILMNFSQKLLRKRSLVLDVYDYHATSASRFPSLFTTYSGISSAYVSQTSYPSAIWAGYKLYTQALDGLLWVASDKGKRSFPSYDLIFLGALRAQGYTILLGKSGSENTVVVVAPSLADAEMLYETGLLLLPLDIRNKTKKLVNDVLLIY